jgi:2-oxoisovalerate dehydrogenase E1 component
VTQSKETSLVLSGALNDPSHRRRIYTSALTIRKVEQKLLELFAEGKLFGTVHTCIGQELSGVAIAEFLKPGDLIFSNHRCHGHFLAHTANVEGLIAEVMGKKTGICGGRGGSQHLCSGGFYSNGIQGGIVPVSAGLAFALKRENAGNIAVVFIGDGTLGEGVLYESLNLVAKWKLPLLVVLENNLYAQSTHQSQTLAGDICARAAAFGIETERAATWEPAELLAIAEKCIEKTRRTRMPHFLRIDTHRLMAHSKGDDTRDKEEVKSYWNMDPLTVFEREFPLEAAEISANAVERVKAAAASAESADYATLRESDEDPMFSSPVNWQRVTDHRPERIVQLLNIAFKSNMERDERIHLIGEDIEGAYGGAFKVTKDLSQMFPGRVRNTPISEAAIVGLGNGMALKGLIPVVEVMFGDFLFLAADQIVNHAAKFRYMYNEQVTVPIILRTPMGGKRGYGPTHSQSLEKHFLGVPGTRVLALNSRQDPAIIYNHLFESLPGPTIVVENKILYGVRLSEKLPAGFVLEQTDEACPAVRLRPEAEPDVTVVCYGGMLPDAERAADVLFDEHDIVSEIICPTQLYPLNIWPILDSVSKTGKLLVVEEGVSFAAFGAELIAQLSEQASGVIRRVMRLGSRRHPIPSCGHLEHETLPTAQTIIETVRLLMN